MTRPRCPISPVDRSLSTESIGHPPCRMCLLGRPRHADHGRRVGHSEGSRVLLTHWLIDSTKTRQTNNGNRRHKKTTTVRLRRGSGGFRTDAAQTRPVSLLGALPSQSGTNEKVSEERPLAPDIRLLPPGLDSKSYLRHPHLHIQPCLVVSQYCDPRTRVPERARAFSQEERDSVAVVFTVSARASQIARPNQPK